MTSSEYRPKSVEPPRSGETESPYCPNEKPFWKVIEEIGAQVSIQEWEKLPQDLSERVDEYLYQRKATD